METITFQIRGEYIDLIKLLKATGIAETGSRAQEMVMDNIVKLNGTLETRKRAKIRPGDRVETPFAIIEVE